MFQMEGVRIPQTSVNSTRILAARLAQASELGGGFSATDNVIDEVTRLACNITRQSGVAGKMDG